MTKPPCHNCNRRKRLCHADCELYKIFRGEIDDLKKADRSMRIYEGYISDRVRMEKDKLSKIERKM